MVSSKPWPVVSDECIDQIHKVCNRLLDCAKGEQDEDFLGAVQALRAAALKIPTSPA